MKYKGGRIRFVRACAALAAALALVSGAAAAQIPGPYARQLAQQLASGEQGFALAGFTRAAGPFAGELANRETARVPITLRAGQNYRLFGVCDADCGGLELRLIDGANTLISAETTRSAAPMVEVRPARTGQFQVEIAMHGCAATACYYAFNVYSR